MRIPLLRTDLHSSQEHARNAARLADQAVHRLASMASSLQRREDSNDSPCQKGDNSARCQTPASVESSQNLAIILGVVIPLTCAIIVLIFLHRRHLKKQKLEDINDPHKSLDFGMEGIAPATSRNRGKKGPEMRATEIGGASSRRHHGLSMDIGMHMDSPYILPAGLNGSRESLHSMSRSMHDEHDPYRPVTQMHPRPSADNDSIRFGRLNDDKGSLYSMSTGHHSALQDKAGLIANARPMSQSFGRRADATSPIDSKESGEVGTRPFHSAMNASKTGPPARSGSVDRNIPDIIEEKDLPPPPAPPKAEPAAEPMPPSSISSASTPIPPRKDSMSNTVPDDDRPESSNYGDDDSAMPFRMTVHEPETYDINPDAIYTGYAVDDPSPAPVPTLDAPPKPAGQRISIMGLRPLPPDVPDDNPEVRANRIRSFYKEYFDDSKPNPTQGTYDDDIYGAYMDGIVFDPETGGFYAPSKPFAQGPGRRAMTPPPRSRPRVSGNSGGPHFRQHSTYSTMSGRPRGRSLPKKNLPPPKALTDLPTPHLMKDDSAIFNAADFAPPTTFRNMQNGSRPASPMGMQRPYSPSVKPFSPLASSFDNLAVLPSPHDLRKSGTFTALDFAPPSKIRDPMLSPSDAGSIRSNRSGMSAMQRQAVREGAYRVSRIPKELVTTHDDMAMLLKPRMNLTSAA